MTIYSPSQCDTWLRCPVLRHLEYPEGWKPRRVTKPNMAALLGTAFGESVNHHNRGLRDGFPADVAGCLEKGLASMAREQLKWHEQGRVVDMDDQPYLSGLEAKLEKLVHYYLGRGLPSKWKVLDVEHPLPQHGNARIDLGVDDGFGPAVLDYKVKSYLKATDDSREINRWRNSWAMYHYTWAYGVAHETVIDRYYICMIVAEPKLRMELLPFPVHQEAMTMWLTSARRVWEQMEKEDQGTAEPWMASRHGDEYGPCPFYKACFTYQFDESLMKNEYVRRQSSGQK